MLRRLNAWRTISAPWAFSSSRCAVPIQCLARQIISRARVRARRQQIVRDSQKAALESAAEAWAPSLLTELCPAHQQAGCTCTHLSCTLQETDIEIFCRFEAGSIFIVTVLDQLDNELQCRCDVDRERLEQTVRAHLHQSIDELLATAHGREEALRIIMTGMNILVARQADFIKCTWTGLDVTVDGEDMVISI